MVAATPVVGFKPFRFLLLVLLAIAVGAWRKAAKQLVSEMREQRSEYKAGPCFILTKTAVAANAGMTVMEHMLLPLFYHTSEAH